VKTIPELEDLVGRLEADLEARIRSLFLRYPALCGFAVQPGAAGRADPYPIPDSGLCITNVSVHPDVGWLYEDIQDEIVCALADLVQERPYARDYLRDRTFARVLQ
jgi:hypothetical protein